MIPISDQARSRPTFPIVMLLLLAANLSVFAYQIYQAFFVSPQALQQLIEVFGVIPYEIVRGTDLPPPTPFPVYLTIFTSMFVHGGLLHVGSNMLFLWVFGDNVEAAMGHLRFLLFYLLTGVGAVFGQVLADPLSQTPAVGASGAISGILAAYLLFYPRARIRVLLIIVPFITITQVSAVFLIGLWIVLQILSGLAELGISQTGGIAYWAHIGGFFTGLILANRFRRPSQYTR